MKKIIIGIDCGVNTGFALSAEGKISEILTMTFWGAVNRIRHYHLIHGINLMVYIEDPNDNKPIFKRANVSDIRPALKLAQNVGMNKRDAQLIIEFCADNGITYYTIKPTSSKWTAAALKHYTGITERTSQHARDAIKLIYGR